MPDYRQIEQHARIMATDVGVHLACAPDDTIAATAAIEACLDWLREVDRRLTRFDEASELCHLNAAAGRWQAVSPLLFEVIAHSIAAAHASDGLFDPMLLSLIEQFGYDQDFALITSDPDRETQREVPEARARTHHGDAGMWRGIELDEARHRVRLPSAARLDVGGIAKGWAADVALDRFFSAFPNVLIDVGGDMRVRGCGADGEPWPVGVRNPRTSASQSLGHSAVVSLAAGGVACSGAIDRWWRQDGERRHHLLDPRTQRPAPMWLGAVDEGEDAADLIATATAFAPTAAHAEVAAKVALLRGYPEALHVVDAAWDSSRAAGETPSGQSYGDERVALLLVMGDGAVRHSANLRAWLSELGSGGDVWLD